MEANTSIAVSVLDRDLSTLERWSFALVWERAVAVGGNDLPCRDFCCVRGLNREEGNEVIIR